MNKSNPTILQIIPALNAGGAERTTVDIAQAIIDKGWNAIVVSNGGRLKSELEAMNALHIELPVHSKNPFVMLKNAWALREIIKKYDVNIIHARSRAPAMSGFIAANWCKIPFITTYHGIYNSKNAMKRLYNSVMARGVAIIANSQFTADHIASEHGAIAKNIVVIPRGTDFTKLNPEFVSATELAEIRAIWGVTANKRIILLPARLTRWKGQLVLIDAIAQLSRNGQLPDDVQVVLAGDSQGRVEYVTELTAKISEANLHDVVRIMPHISNMRAAYAASYMVVVPSTDPEAFGRVPVEAQGMEKPVIVSNHGAPRETVINSPENARTGWRVTPNNVHELATAVQEVLNLSAAEYVALGQLARAHVVAHYDLAQMKAATLAVYAQNMQKK